MPGHRWVHPRMPWLRHPWRSQGGSFFALGLGPRMAPAPGRPPCSNEHKKVITAAAGHPGLSPHQTIALLAQPSYYAVQVVSGAN